MEIFAAVSVCVLVLTALVVTIKTLALWCRTRGLPELLLGVLLLSGTVLGYPLAIAGTRIPASEVWAIHVASQLLFSIGYGCLLVFTLRVFRAGVLWARCLVGLSILVLAGTTAVYFVEVTGENPRAAMELPGLTLASTAVIGLAYFWTTIEALRYYRQLRLRLRLGLAEVVVANRVLLWGLMTLAAGLAVIISVAAFLAGSFLSPAVVAVCSILGLIHAGCLLLAFHPPAWYRLWLERRYATEAG